jgi:hypothetical protein
MKFTKPSFCFIAPTEYLNNAASHSSTHLVLAHLVDNDPIYTKWYRDAFALGDFIMMDNSAYELKEPYSPDRLVDLANECGANAIVLPDYPFESGYVTIEAAKKYIPIFKNAGFKTFFVPQSKKGDIIDWIRTYEWAVNNDDIDIIGMSILGIPNALPNIDPAFARVVMTQLLQSEQKFANGKHHHYLGLNAGPGLEIPSLLRMGALDSIDSSGPVWAGILGHEYSTNTDSLQAVSKIKLPVDFACPYSKDVKTIERIQSNILKTLNLFSTFDDIGLWYANE